MKEWFSDKKNLPIIIGVAVVLLIGGVVGGLFATGVLGGSSSSTTASTATTTAPPTTPAPAATSSTAPAATPDEGTTPAAPAGTLGGAPTTPAPAGAAPPAAGAMSMGAMNFPPSLQARLAEDPKARAEMAKLGLPVTADGHLTPVAVSKLKAMIASGSFKQLASIMTGGSTGHPDPFQPVVDAKKLASAGPPAYTLASVINAATIRPLPLPGAQHGPWVQTPQGEEVALGRLSGVILSNGVHAIYETMNGDSSVVQPGDELPDNAGRVQSIQDDGITVRLADNRVVQLPITAGNDTNMPGAGGQYGMPYGGSPYGAPPYGGGPYGNRGPASQGMPPTGDNSPFD